MEAKPDVNNPLRWQFSCFHEHGLYICIFIGSWLGKKRTVIFLKILNSLSKSIRHSFNEFFDWGIIYVLWHAHVVSVQFDGLTNAFIPNKSQMTLAVTDLSWVRPQLPQLELLPWTLWTCISVAYSTVSYKLNYALLASRVYVAVCLFFSKHHGFDSSCGWRYQLILLLLLSGNLLYVHTMICLSFLLFMDISVSCLQLWAIIN